MTHHSTAEPNPALAPGRLEAFVLRSERVWDSRMEDLEQLLGQLAHPKSGSLLRKLHHEASSCPALTLLLEALPEPGFWEPHRPSHFLQALNHGPFISDCTRANGALPLEQLFSLLSAQPSQSPARRCPFSSHIPSAPWVQLSSCPQGQLPMSLMDLVVPDPLPPGSARGSA